MTELTRRQLMGRSVLGAAAAAFGGKLVFDQRSLVDAQGAEPGTAGHSDSGHGSHDGLTTVGQIGDLPVGIDPHVFLNTFDYGQTSKMAGGRWPDVTGVDDHCVRS